MRNDTLLERQESSRLVVSNEHVRDDEAEEDDGKDVINDNDDDEYDYDDDEIIKGETSKDLRQCFLPVWRLKPFWKCQSHNSTQGSGQ